MTLAIEAVGLVKRFGKTLAVDGVDLAVRPGMMIRALVAEGTTVLLTTQYLDEADRLANQIAVIDHGRVIATGTAAELKAKIGQQTLDVRPADPADLTRVTGIVAAAVGRARSGRTRIRACCPSPSMTPRPCRP